MAPRFAEVTLQAPAGRNGHDPAIPVWAVFAQEQDAPAGVKPLEWLLLTTLCVTSFEQATEKLLWYTRRWGIEVLHPALFWRSTLVNWQFSQHSLRSHGSR